MTRIHWWRLAAYTLAIALAVVIYGELATALLHGRGH